MNNKLNADLLERAENNLPAEVDELLNVQDRRTVIEYFAKFAQTEIERVRKEDGKAIDAWWEKLNLEKQQSDILKRTLEKERAEKEEIKKFAKYADTEWKELEKHLKAELEKESNNFEMIKKVLNEDGKTMNFSDYMTRVNDAMAALANNKTINKLLENERTLVDRMSMAISKMLLCSEPELTLVATEALQAVKKARG